MRAKLDGRVNFGNHSFQTIQGLAGYYDSQEFEEKYTYEGNDLGSTYSPEKTVFKLWSPAATEVSVIFYRTGSDEEKGSAMLGRWALKKDPQHPGVWVREFEGDYKNLYYNYLVTAAGKENRTADPYAKAAGVNGDRSMVVDLPATDPEGWDLDPYAFKGASTEAVLYEAHVKDFSHDHNSGMSPRGMYAAMGLRGTMVYGSVSNGVMGESSRKYAFRRNAPATGIDHLLDLGVTHVHLLPIQDYATVDETGKDDSYNWGYDPKNYNVPEGSYSQDPYHGEYRIQELKDMILRMHKAGLGVIMDVVYNHTYETEKSWFHRTCPFYYHRTTSDGSFGNASGCGNETASERSMMRRYMLDSLKYWATEYHIDGFRFDLMGIHDVETMNQIRRMLDELGEASGKKYILYGEPWAALPPSMREGSVPANMGNLKLLDPNIGVFSDRTRDAVKGSCFDKEEGGFVNGGTQKEEAIRDALKAYWEEDGSMPPTRTISYVSSHDNYTLWDKLAMTVPTDGSGFDTPELIRMAANKLAAAIIFTSQGIPFFQAGEEMGRSKYGDGNSYKSNSLINDIRWDRLIRFGELTDYYRGLIRIRKSFSPFTDATGKAAASIRYIDLGEGAVACVIPGMKETDSAYMVLAFNARNEEVSFTLPEELGDSWGILADETFASDRPIKKLLGSECKVFMRSCLIAASERKVGDPAKKVINEAVKAERKPEV